MPTEFDVVNGPGLGTRRPGCARIAEGRDIAGLVFAGLPYCSICQGSTPCSAVLVCVRRVLFQERYFEAFSIANSWAAIVNPVVEQLSLLEQFRVEDPNVADAEHVRRIARSITSDLDLTAPVDFDIISSYQGIGAVQVTNIPWAGCLVDEQGKLVIKLRKVDGRRRRRFTWAHELAHTFFPGFSYQPQFRCNPSSAPTNTGSDIEALCDLAAAELLFPAQAFRQDLADDDPTLETVEDLSHRYVASLEATAHRTIELVDRPAMMVVLKEMKKPADRGDPAAKPKLRVSYAYGRGDWPFIPKWKSADPTGPLASALNGEVVDEIATLSDLTQHNNTEVRVSARLYPYYDDQGNLHKRVIALYQ